MMITTDESLYLACELYMVNMLETSLV